MNSTNPFKGNPLNRIIGLAVILSAGFLLIVLACINGNWLPIIVGLVFASAHIPLAVASAFNVSQDFSFDPAGTSSASAFSELATFSSGLLLALGFGIPVVLHHLHILTSTATTLCIGGGMMIYGTIHAFSRFFDPDPTQLDDFGGQVI